MKSQRTQTASAIRTTMILLAIGALVLPSVGCNLFFPGITDPSAIDAGDSFDSARPIAVDNGVTLTFTGIIDGDEVDYFDLGAVQPGDRIQVTVEASAGSTLDPTTALFDASQELWAHNDDVDLVAGLFGSAIDDYVTIASDHLYLAITKFFLETAGGAYTATVRIDRTGTVPTPAPQTLLLNFAGGPVSITSEGDFTIDPFDAADIDPVYAGQTAAIKAQIIAVVRENFAETGLIIVTTDDNPALTEGTYSTIHFGAFSPTKFGVADSVDGGNKDRCDDGIVFTNSFDNPFATQPTPDGIATAIGNVAAHEAGHLLGLNHVADITALMDNTGTASTLLADQDFKTAPLSPSVFPAGHQNAPAMLQRVVPK